jgi:metallo-beta-lactamase class B
MIQTLPQTLRRPYRSGVIVAISGLAIFAAAQSHLAAQPRPSPAAVDLTKECKDRDGWSDPTPPARIFGNTWYVGTCGISAVLVTSDRGHILIDGGTAAAAPMIAANIQKLGFRLSDVRWIVSSHEHHDHVGGLAELKRLTGAKVAALNTAVQVLATGKTNPEDPQFAQVENFTPVPVDRILRDGDDVVVGPLQLTVHATPAHAPGSASWTWTSCAGADCRTVAYADSATLISDDGYRFTAHPERIKQAHIGLERMADLPCDILVTPHPGASNLFARMAGQAPLVDPEACRRHANRGEQLFAERLARETGNTAR